MEPTPEQSYVLASTKPVVVVRAPRQSGKSVLGYMLAEQTQRRSIYVTPNLAMQKSLHDHAQWLPFDVSRAYFRSIGGLFRNDVRRIRPALLFIDEAQFYDLAKIEELLDIAQLHDARIVFVGTPERRKYPDFDTINVLARLTWPTVEVFDWHAPNLRLDSRTLQNGL